MTGTGHFGQTPSWMLKYFKSIEQVFHYVGNFCQAGSLQNTPGLKILTDLKAKKVFQKKGKLPLKLSGRNGSICRSDSNAEKEINLDV